MGGGIRAKKKNLAPGGEIKKKKHYDSADMIEEESKENVTKKRVLDSRPWGRSVRGAFRRRSTKGKGKRLEGGEIIPRQKSQELKWKKNKWTMGR